MALSRIKYKKILSDAPNKIKIITEYKPRRLVNFCVLDKKYNRTKKGKNSTFLVVIIAILTGSRTPSIGCMGVRSSILDNPRIITDDISLFLFEAKYINIAIPIAIDRYIKIVAMASAVFVFPKVAISKNNGHLISWV